MTVEQLAEQLDIKIYAGKDAAHLPACSVLSLSLIHI